MDLAEPAIYRCRMRTIIVVLLAAAAGCAEPDETAKRTTSDGRWWCTPTAECFRDAAICGSGCKEAERVSCVVAQHRDGRRVKRCFETVEACRAVRTADLATPDWRVIADCVSSK